MIKEIEEFCKQVGITVAQFKGEKVIYGNLSITNNITVPPGFAARITGYLCLYHDAIIHEDFTPVIGGFLYLNHLVKLSSGFAPVVGYFIRICTANNLSSGFRPVMGGSFYLESATDIPEDFAPVVGGDLHLYKVTSLPATCSPTVGGSLFLKDKKTAEAKQLDRTQPVESHDGHYIIANNLLTEFVSREGNIWQVRHIGKTKILYLVTNGSGKFAHSATLADAQECLIYKISKRDTSRYKGLSKDYSFTFEEAVEMYYSITYACPDGIRKFVKSHNIKKKRYTIKEIIDMTQGQFGNDGLVKFFSA